MPVQFPTVTVPQQRGTDLSSSYLQGRQAAEARQQTDLANQLKQEELFGRSAGLNQQLTQHKINAQLEVLALKQTQTNAAEVQAKARVQYKSDMEALGSLDDPGNRVKLYRLQKRYEGAGIGVTADSSLLPKEPSPLSAADTAKQAKLTEFTTKLDTLMSEEIAAGRGLGHATTQQKVAALQMEYQPHGVRVTNFAKMFEGATLPTQSEIEKQARIVFDVRPGFDLPTVARQWVKAQLDKTKLLPSSVLAKEARDLGLTGTEAQDYIREQKRLGQRTSAQKEAEDLADSNRDGVIDDTERPLYEKTLKELIEKQAPRTTITTVGAKGETEFQKEMGKRSAARYGAGAEAAQERAASMALLQQTLVMLPLVETGRLAPTKLAMAEFAKDMGLGSLVGKIMSGEIGIAQAMRAGTNRQALKLKKDLPGQISNFEVKFMVQSAAGLANTPIGNYLIVFFQMRTAKAEEDEWQREVEYTNRRMAGEKLPTWEKFNLDYKREHETDKKTFSEGMFRRVGGEGDYYKEEKEVPNYTVFYQYDPQHKSALKPGVMSDREGNDLAGYVIKVKYPGAGG